MKRDDFAKCPQCETGRMSVQSGGSMWCDNCETKMQSGITQASFHPRRIGEVNEAFKTILRWCDRSGEEPEGQCLHEIEQICRKQLGLELLKLSEPMDRAYEHGTAGMEIIDHADGVAGHFCIGRRISAGIGSNFYEFYNRGFWQSAGQVFTSRASADFKLDQLAKEAYWEANPPTQEEISRMQFKSRELTPEEHTEERIKNATEGAVDAYDE